MRAAPPPSGAEALVGNNTGISAAPPAPLTALRTPRGTAAALSTTAGNTTVSTTTASPAPPAVGSSALPQPVQAPAALCTPRGAAAAAQPPSGAARPASGASASTQPPQAVPTVPQATPRGNAADAALDAKRQSTLTPSTQQQVPRAQGDVTPSPRDATTPGLLATGRAQQRLDARAPPDSSSTGANGVASAESGSDRRRTRSSAAPPALPSAAAMPAPVTSAVLEEDTSPAARRERRDKRLVARRIRAVVKLQSVYRGKAGRRRFAQREARALERAAHRWRRWWWFHEPDSVWAFLRFLLFYAPFGTLALSAALGALMASIEGWTAQQGLLWVISLVCGLAQPLTPLVPASVGGNLFALILAPWAVAFVGLLVGFVSNLGFPVKALRRYERLVNWLVTRVVACLCAPQRSRPTATLGSGAAVRTGGAGAKAPAASATAAGADLETGRPRSTDAAKQRCCKASAKSINFVSDVIAFFAMVLLVLPVLVMITSALIGLPIAGAEQWPPIQAALWVMGSMAMLPSPLISSFPSTEAGFALATLNAVYTLVAVVLVFGAAAGLSVVEHFAKWWDSGWLKGWPALSFFCLTVFSLPLVGALVALMGAILAAHEGWGTSDGILFVASILCNLGNPLTSLEPTTFGGDLHCVVVAVWTMALMGCWLGVAGNLELPSVIIRLLERLTHALTKPVIGALPSRAKSAKRRVPGAVKVGAKASPGAGPGAGKTPSSLEAMEAELGRDVKWLAYGIAFGLCFAIILPLIINLFGAIFGAIMARSEAGWTFQQGYLYVLSNALGLPNPLTSVQPASTGGIVASIFIGSIALTYISTLMGAISAFHIVGLLFGDGEDDDDD